MDGHPRPRLRPRPGQNPAYRPPRRVTPERSGHIWSRQSRPGVSRWEPRLVRRRPRGDDRSVFRRKRRDDDIFMKLRATALGAAEQGLPAPPSDHAHVSGVVIDIPRQGGTATLVAMTDNTTSLYTSTGGGTLVTGNHAPVAAATHARPPA